jgi:hypothetical protein
VLAGSGEVVVITTAGLIVTANARLAVAVTLSVTWAVKLNVPAAVGVPLSTPLAGFSVSPGGGVPALTTQLRGSVPPEAARVSEYAPPTVPVGSGEVVVIASAGLMVRVNARVAVAATLSVTWAVKVNVPAAVSMPLSAPLAGFSVNPGGGAPALTTQLRGRVPPEAASVTA